GLTIDKFLQKLRDNKAQLVSKHACRTVRFSVYVKDGKAALKATPVRE
ncbi:MAG TPA: MXAN_5187 C-terminal domain-containing protein, partial [Polyangia bacterium]|nr:MXAN_5187 C-terminal domain-containing protein [Polyangia bacterium]